GRRAGGGGGGGRPGGEPGRGAADDDGVGRDDRRGPADRPPGRGEVGDQRRPCRVEVEVVGEVAVDHLGGGVDGAPGGEQRLHVREPGRRRGHGLLAPGGAVGTRPHVVTPVEERRSGQ